jgi:hypothetical protein
MTRPEAICDCRTSEGFRRRRREVPGMVVGHLSGRRSSPSERVKRGLAECSATDREYLASRGRSSIVSGGVVEGGVRPCPELLADSGKTPELAASGMSA